MKTVIKRNGKKENFDFNKIRSAIENAYRSVNEEIPVEEINKLEHHLTDICNDSTVEEIQDIVEKFLISQGEGSYKAAKAFILYREKHKQARFIKERIDYMENYSKSSDNAATSSETDANANVTMKNVANLE